MDGSLRRKDLTWELAVVGVTVFVLESLWAGLRGRGLPLPLWYGLLGTLLVGAAAFVVVGLMVFLDRYARAVDAALCLAGVVLVVKGWLVFGGAAGPPLVAMAGVPAGVLLLRAAGWNFGRSRRVASVFLVVTLVVSTDAVGRFGQFLLSLEYPWVFAVLFALMALGVLVRGWAVAGRLVRGLSEHRRTVSIFLAGMVFIAGACWWTTREPTAWGRGTRYRGSPVESSLPPGSSPAELPNIVVISIDTLRRDRTPPRTNLSLGHLDRLRRDSVVFRSAFSNSSVTLPTHASLFTGRLPFEHGAAGQPDDRFTHIYEHIPLYPQVLDRLGYRTAAFTGGGWVRSDFGFDRGYDRYWEQPFSRLPYGDYVPGGVEVLAWLLSGTRYRFYVRVVRPGTGGDRGRPSRRYFREGLERAKGWVREVQGDSRPFYLFLHTYQVHDYRRFYPRATRRLRREHPDLWGILRGKNPLEIPAVDPGALQDFRRRLRSRRPGEWRRTDDFTTLYHKYRAWRVLYEYGVEQVDEQLGAFMDFLRKENLYGPTAVVFLSDHGEGFLLDSGAWFHGQGQLDEVLLRVPLMVKLPHERGRGHRYRGRLQLRDVFPMLLEALGLPDPLSTSRVRRHLLRDILAGNNPPGRTHAVAMIQERNHPLPKLSVRGHRWKLVRSLRTGREDYFAVDDTGPLQRPVEPGSVPPEDRRRLRDRMQRLVERFRAGPNPYRPGRGRHRRGLLNELRGMGYLGGDS